MKLIIIFILFAVNSFPQSYNSQQDPGSADWQKWGKENYSYRIPEDQQQRNYSLKNENTCGTILKSFADIYWFFISDVDGDNCSFNPTCSAFFVQAVKETNILQGTLMFADRFTRDLNLFKLNHYPKSIGAVFP